MTRRNQHYPPELRERAVRMVAEVTPNYDSQWAAIGAVAQKLGVGTAETVRKWVRQAEVDAGERPGATTDESAEIRHLKREVAELHRANEILKAGGCRTNRQAARFVRCWRAGRLKDYGVAYNFVTGDRDQLMLMPPSVADWLLEDHLAWFTLDVVAELDLSAFRAAYRSDGRGGAVYDP